MERKDRGAIAGHGLAARVAGAAALVLGSGVWATRTAAAAARGRGYAAASFALTLDGSPAGMLRSVEGGGAVAEVIVEKASGNPPRKHLGPLRYEDVAVRVGLGVGKPLQDWIAETLAGKPSRRTATVQTIDATGKVRSVRDFQGALISEIGFPALDAASKEPAALTVAWTPESMRAAKAPGKAAKAQAGAKQKQWLACNFRFTLGDLPTDRVSKIDGFTIRQHAAADQVGETREYEKEPGVLEIPNLRVTFAEADLPKWEEWFEDFAIRGNSGDGQELAGRIAFLNPSLAKEIGSIDLEHVGICRLTPEPATAGADAVRRWTAELYVERMTLSLT